MIKLMEIVGLDGQVEAGDVARTWKKALKYYNDAIAQLNSEKEATINEPNHYSEDEFLKRALQLEQWLDNIKDQVRTCIKKIKAGEHYGGLVINRPQI